MNAQLLSFMNNQAIAAVCRELYEWSCVRGRRVCCRVDDSRGPPFVPLDRVATQLVDVLHLSRGRDSAQERAEAVVTCSSATVLLCTYSALTGLSLKLDWGSGISACLNLRVARFRQCRLTADDVAKLLVCCPKLHTIALIGEDLSGLSQELRVGQCALRHLHVTDCRLVAEDATTLLCPTLESVHLQSMDLKGLRAPLLSSLRTLSLIDCCLSRMDAVRLLARCCNLERVELCGNPLGSESRLIEFDNGRENDDIGDDGDSWPVLPSLRHADFRFCDLDSDDEADLRISFESAVLECRARLEEQPARTRGDSGRHVVFDSDSEDRKSVV